MIRSFKGASAKETIAASVVLIALVALVARLVVLPRVFPERFKAPPAATLRRGLDRMAPLAQTLRTRRAARFHSNRRCDGSKLERSCGRVQTLAFSGDGKLIATTDYDSATLWNAESGGPHTHYSDLGQAAIFFSNSGEHFVVFKRGLARVIHIEEPRAGIVFPHRRAERVVGPCARERHSAPTGTGALSPRGDVLALSGFGLCLYDLRSARLLHRLAGCGSPEGPVQTLAFSPDGRRLVIGCAGELSVVDVKTGGVLQRIRPEQLALGPALFVGPSGSELLVTGTRTKPELTPQGHKVFRLANAEVFAGFWRIGRAKEERLIRLGTAAEVHGVGGHDFSSTQFGTPQLGVAVSPDGSRLLVGGHGACFWSAASGRKQRCLFEDAAVLVTGVAWSPTGSVAATIERDAESASGELHRAELHRVRLWRGEALN